MNEVSISSHIRVGSSNDIQTALTPFKKIGKKYKYIFMTIIIIFMTNYLKR